MKEEKKNQKKEYVPAEMRMMAVTVCPKHFCEVGWCSKNYCPVYCSKDYVFKISR
jgi:hypothetical protein